MPSISIYLFGPARVSVGPDGQDLKIGRSALSLLVFLAIHAERPLTREAVAAELWPDCELGKGRSRLSTAIWRLRKALAGVGCEDALIADRDGSLGLAPGVHSQVDINRFQGLARAWLDDPDGSRCPVEPAHALPGEPLAGWYDVWALSTRVRLEDLRERCLTLLLEKQIEEGQDAPAVETAEALLTCDPLREDIHQALMRLHHAHGRPGQAERQYLRCRESLQEELGILPMPQTESLRPAREQTEPSAVPMHRDPVGERAVLTDLRKALHETQQSLAQVSNRLDVLLCR